MTESATANAIDVDGLRLTYDDGTVAVRNVDLTVPDGEFFGFLGPNGASKTTTIKVLSTHLNPTAGTVRVTDSTRSTRQTPSDGRSDTWPRRPASTANSQHGRTSGSPARPTAFPATNERTGSTNSSTSSTLPTLPTSVPGSSPAA